MSDPQVELLDRFFAALRVGDLEAWKSHFGREMRAELEEMLSSDEERKEFMERQKLQAPDRFEIVDRAVDEAEGLVQLVVETVQATEAGEQTERVIVTTAEEDGAWRVLDILPAADPAADEPSEFERAADDERGEIDDYNVNQHTSLGGPLVRVSFGEDYSLLVVRVLRAEQSVFLPTRQKLEDAGIDPDSLVPDAIVEIEGHAHGSDPRKVLGTNLIVRT